MNNSRENILETFRLYKKVLLESVSAVGIATAAGAAMGVMTALGYGFWFNAVTGFKLVKWMSAGGAVLGFAGGTAYSFSKGREFIRKRREESRPAMG